MFYQGQWYVVLSLKLFAKNVLEILEERAFLMLNQGQRSMSRVEGHRSLATSIGIHLPCLKLFTQTVEILQERAIFICLIKVESLGQRSGSKSKVEIADTVISIGIHLASLKLLALTVLEILEERAILMINQGQRS